jgi:serine/threonine protein kinase/Tfp pilus assembly protein PilF
MSQPQDKGLAESLDSVQHDRVHHFLHDDPTDIGPYHILAPVGQGGMGIVYKAEQRAPVRRIVALKLIKLGMDTHDVLARFETERQALAMMNHPNVAKVFDAGTTDRGRPYFVMEHVPGESITAFCDKHQLSISQRLELFIQACEAVQHAHHKAIIHRDLKPSNILVCIEEDRHVVKVIDFGVAKAIAQQLTERTLFTETGRLLGTPEYMSPEQADASDLDEDTRTDIYSLGVVLYELLAGALPFDAKTLRSAGFQEIQRVIREVDPPRPSTRLSTLGAGAAEVARRRQTQIDALQRQLRGELEWIPLKAMRKDRTERYATAAELAQDIRNYLNERPLQAGPESPVYRMRKFLRRNKTGVAASAAMLFLLLAGITATTWQAIRATRAERSARAALAEVERHKARVEAKQLESEAVVQFLTEHVLEGATPARLPDTAVRDTIVRVMLDPAAAAIGKSFAQTPMVESSVRATLAGCYRALGRPELGAPHAEWALERRRATLGNEHPATLEAINLMAAVMHDQGRFAEAEKFLVESLETGERVLGREHAETRRARASLGDVLMNQGRYAEAEPLQRLTLEQDKRLGAAPRSIIASTQGLALTLMLTGQLDEAEVHFRDCHELARRELGERDPSTIVTINGLGQILERRGKLEESKAAYVEALAASREVLGEDHMTTLILANNIGSVLKKMGKNEEAERYYREVSTTMRRIFGEEHPNTLTAINNLGNVLFDQQRYEEAEPLLRESLEGRRKLLGDAHPLTVQAIYAAGRVLLMRNRHADAEPLFAELYRLAQTSELTDRQRATFMAEWGPCLVQLKRYADAEQPLREAHRRLTESGQTRTPHISRVLDGLVAICEHSGRADEAARWGAELDALLASTRPATRPAGGPTTAPALDEL